METSAIGVIILTHNDYKYTLDCLRRVHSQCDLPRRIVVCDNGSCKETVNIIFERWTEIAIEFGMENPVEVFDGEVSGAQLVLLRNEENLGVGAGINQGLRFLLYDKVCEAFWILHNDTLPEPYALSALADFLHECEHKAPHALDNKTPQNQTQTNQTQTRVKQDMNIATKNFGLVGSNLIFVENSLQECAGGGKWSSLIGKPKLLDFGFERFAHSEPEEVMKKLDYINGASCLITRKLIDAIGLFDERLFLFYEDLDYGIRAKKAGFSLGWAHGSVVKHYAPCGEMFTPVLSITEAPNLAIDAEYFYIRNRFYLLAREKKYFLIFAFLNLLCTPFRSCGKSYSYSNTKKTHKHRETLLFRFKAALDGVRGKMD